MSEGYLSEALKKLIFYASEVLQLKFLPTLGMAVRWGSPNAIIIPKVRPYLEHGFLELDNNTAERAMRPIAIDRKNYLFLGSEKGGKSAAICYSLIETCKLNGVNPQSWLTHALANIQDTKLSDLDKLLPWNYIEES